MQQAAQNESHFVGTLIYMVIKPSIVLAAAVLIAVSLSAPFVRAATDPLMPTGPGDGVPDNGVQPFDPDPAASGSLTRQILTYGTDADGKPVPRKTLRITNNAVVTVYPFMRSPNTGTITIDPKVAVYDPYDPANKEYRGYIGYKDEQSGQYYFGLKSGQSILVSLPLVFWNGGRIHVGTDSKYLTAAANPNPERYDPNARRAIAPAEANGVIMWYRAELAVGPTDDAEDQLAEWTIRDHAYLSNPKITLKSNGEIPDNQLLNLMNYDVSNVDTLYLPLALEANDTWVVPQVTDPKKATDRTKPNLTGGWSAGSHPDVFGWTGAINRICFLQARIREFTAENNTLLGRYFGGKGWPFYNFPGAIIDPSVPIKIPSGANIFPQSPGKGTGDRSSYDNEKYMLSSGGTEKIAETIAAEGDQSHLANNQVRLSQNEPQSKIAFVQMGYVATANTTGKNPIPPGTTVKAVDGLIVTLSQRLVASAVASSITFTRPKHDYAAEAMIRLWYSWAQYYLMHWKDKTPCPPCALTAATPILGSNQAATATLTFNEPHRELVKGMAVTGPGLDNAQTEKGVHQGDAVILDIASDHKSVVLSQVMIPSSTNQLFTFSPPKALLWTPTTTEDAGYPLIGDQFQFSNEPERHDPYKFSQQVYLIMASMNQIGHPNNDNAFKFMQDIVGANMGFIFTQQAKDSDDGKRVTSMIRDMIKSVLRGVIDFTKDPDVIDGNGNHTSWYPDPAEPRGGQAFNVFNLDPFVWFVHVKLGFSGYGFSVDDDKADIGSEGQSQLQLSIAGTEGLKNPAEWSIQAPYGTVKNISVVYSGQAIDVRPATGNNGETLYNAITNVSHTTPIRITTPNHLANGDTVFIEEVEGENAANGRFKVGHVTTNTFDLFHGDTPVAPIGTYTGKGKWSYPLHPFLVTGPDPKKVFYRVKGDDALGTFQGTFVSVHIDGKDVEGNPITGKNFRVWQLGLFDDGHLLLDADLTNADGTPLPAGTYPFTFFGIAEPGTPLGGAPCTDLGAIRQELRHDIREDRQELKQLGHIEVPHERSIRRWLRVQLQVLQARRTYPTDEVLKQIDESMGSEPTSLSKAEKQRILARLNTRLAELQGGG